MRAANGGSVTKAVG